MTTSEVSAGLSLCVVNYNGAHLLRDTLQAALASSTGFDEIIFVDNASSDGSAELVEREFPEVQLLRLSDNRGPGAARNAGLRAASTDRVLFVDNDVLLHTTCASQLAGVLDEEPEAVIAVPRVLYRNTPEVIQYDGAASHFLGLLAPENANLPLAAAPTEVRSSGSLISACFLLDRSRLAPDAFFDEAFFIYQEDHDFGLRARLGGGRILSVPSALCYHGDGTAGLSLRATGRHQPLRVEATIRNRWLILLQNYQGRTLLLLSPALLLFECIQAAGALKKGWHREWWRALRSTIDRRQVIRSRRRAVQRTRKLGDGALLHGGSLPFTAEIAQGRSEQLAREVLALVSNTNWRLVHRWLDDVELSPN